MVSNRLLNGQFLVDPTKVKTRYGYVDGICKYMSQNILSFRSKEALLTDPHVKDSVYHQFTNQNIL